MYEICMACMRVPSGANLAQSRIRVFAFLHGFMASAVQASGADGGTLGPQDGSRERGSLPAPYLWVPEG